MGTFFVFHARLLNQTRTRFCLLRASFGSNKMKQIKRKGVINMIKKEGKGLFITRCLLWCLWLSS